VISRRSVKRNCDVYYHSCYSFNVLTLYLLKTINRTLSKLDAVFDISMISFIFILFLFKDVCASYCAGVS